MISFILQILESKALPLLLKVIVKWRVRLRKQDKNLTSLNQNPQARDTAATAIMQVLDTAFRQKPGARGGMSQPPGVALYNRKRQTMTA